MKSLRLLVVCLCTAVAGLFVLATLHTREVAVNVARREASNLTRALAQQAADTIEEADGTLLGLRQQVELYGDATPATRAELHDSMARSIALMPRLHSLRIIDEHGTIVLDNAWNSRRVDVNVGDREYFIHHMHDPSQAAYITGPLLSRVEHVWIVSVTRRFNRPDGRFAGVLEVAIPIDYFLASYTNVDIGKNGALLLLRADGTVLVRRPLLKTVIGLKVTNAPPFTGPDAKLTYGSETYTSPFDGVLRMVNFRRIERYPLVMIVAEAEGDYLGSWRTDALIHLAVTICIIVLVVGLGAFISSQIRRRKRAKEAAERLALFDGLTDIANRRHLDEFFNREWRNAVRRRTSLACIMIEVDHFKEYNDEYGAVQGDDALKTISEAIVDNIRPTDLAARYGGVEFIVVLPATDGEMAFELAERIRKAISGRGLQHAQTEPGRVTVSAGVAGTVPISLGQLGALTDTVKRALAEARRTGDRTVVLEHSELRPSKHDSHVNLDEFRVLTAVGVPSTRKAADA